MHKSILSTKLKTSLILHKLISSLWAEHGIFAATIWVTYAAVVVAPDIGLLLGNVLPLELELVDIDIDKSDFNRFEGVGAELKSKGVTEVTVQLFSSLVVIFDNGLDCDSLLCCSWWFCNWAEYIKDGEANCEACCRAVLIFVGFGEDEKLRGTVPFWELFNAFWNSVSFAARDCGG